MRYAMCLLQNSDPKRFGSLITRLRNDYTLGDNKYPTTRAAAAEAGRNSRGKSKHTHARDRARILPPHIERRLVCMTIQMTDCGHGQRHRRTHCLINISSLICSPFDRRLVCKVYSQQRLAREDIGQVISTATSLMPAVMPA